MLKNKHNHDRTTNLRITGDSLGQTYTVRYAEQHELYSVSSQWVDFIPTLYRNKSQQEVLDLKALRQRWLEEHYQKNPKIVTLVCDSREALCGFYILIPLNNYGYQRIVNTAIQNSTTRPLEQGDTGRWIDTNDSSASFHNCKSVWVTMLAGQNKYVQGKTLSLMQDYVKSLIPQGNIHSMLARARTESGQRVMTRYGFKNMGDSGIAEVVLDE